MLALLLLLAHQQLMPAGGLAHGIPIGSQLGVLGAHLARRQLFDLRRVQAHAFLDLADGLQARVKRLQAGLLLRLLVLPGSLRAGQGKPARRGRLGLLQTGLLPVDQVF
ncbi:hypothetical protein A6P55_25600 (plasmid) [Pandoraea pnomenusa]|nr:hypothetical protein A6P55_25600 [Pandoraea pnomenusa]